MCFNSLTRFVLLCIMRKSQHTQHSAMQAILQDRNMIMLDNTASIKKVSSFHLLPIGAKAFWGGLNYWTCGREKSLMQFRGHCSIHSRQKNSFTLPDMFFTIISEYWKVLYFMCRLFTSCCLHMMLIMNQKTAWRFAILISKCLSLQTYFKWISRIIVFCKYILIYRWLLKL